MQDYQKEYTDEQEHSMKRPDLCGLGGWLILVGFSLVTSLLLVVKRLFDLYSFITGEEWFLLTNIHSEYYHPMWKPGIIFEASIIDYILTTQIPMIYETGDISAFSAIIRGSISASIWITYFIKSVRVKNTFVN